MAVLAVLCVAMAACTPSEEPDPEVPFPGETPVSDLDVTSVPDTAATRTGVGLSQGQRLYVPIYSHIHFKNEERTIDLAATISIRNADPDRPIVITTIDYIDNDGALVRRYLEQPRRLGPLASTSVVIEESDAAGGLGANFLVEWQAAQPVHAPIVESIMISTRSSLGISFASPARVLDERSE
jgi:hypothetical protein